MKLQFNGWLVGLFILLALGTCAFLTNGAVNFEAVGEIDGGDTAWILTASCLVLLMTPGLSFFYGGMVNYRNIVSTMLQSYIAMGLITIIWIVCGFSLAFGDTINGFVGNPMTYFMFKGVGVSPHKEIATSIPFVLFAIFQLKFAIITPALITGSFAERVRFSSYLLFMVLFSIFIYAPLAHMTWHPNGILFQHDILDFAGGTVVHMSAGIAALIGAMVLGPRASHKPNSHLNPGNTAYVLLGTGMLWFGWFGFNGGSALGANGIAAHACLTSHIASASAMIAWIFFDCATGRKPSALGACVGAVVGLVAITPGAGFVSYGAAMLIGAISSIISNFAVSIKSKSKLDDTLDVFPCHGLGGIVGMIFTSLFAANEGQGTLVSGDISIFIKHMIALVSVSAFIAIMSYILYKITDLIIPLRVTSEQESLGLDMSQHGEHADDIEYRINSGAFTISSFHDEKGE